MPSDEDLIIQIPDDEPETVDAEFNVIDPDEDTPIDEPNAPKEEAPASDSPDVVSWPAVKLYHPMIGAEGTMDDIPEDHEIWLAANIMMGPKGTPLREGQSNMFVSGKTPEAIGEYIKRTIITVLEQMQEKLSPIQRATPADMEALSRMNPNLRR